MNFLTDEKLLKKTLTIYLAIYPLFGLKIFYNSYLTLLQMLMIIVFMSWTVMTGKVKKKYLKYLMGYLILVGIYTFFHHKNAQDFHSLVPGNFNYNFVSEMLALMKMSMPVFFVFLFRCNKLEKTQCLFIIKSWIILICGQIIAANLVKVSLGSYSDSKITGNIFDWWNQGYDYTQLASKGFFMYANQITCVLLCMLPIVMFFYFQKELNLLYMSGVMLCMLLLGTRTANLGSILVFIALTVGHLFFCVWKKTKINKKAVIHNILLAAAYLLILPASPTAVRSQVYDYLMDEQIVYTDETDTIQDEQMLNDVSNTISMDENADDKNSYIETHYEEKLINPKFILESYPYQYDPEFWYRILELPEELRANYRFLEISMVKRVIEINNNPSDKFWGITNERIQNIFNIERDYLLQYYAFGLVGMILFLGTYFILLLEQGIKVIKEFSFYNACCFSSIVLFLVIAYLSGNIFGQIFSFGSGLIIICQKE